MPMYFPQVDTSRKFWLPATAGQTAAPGSTSELILANCQYLMPGATLSTGKEVMLRITGTKSAGANTATVRLRVGTAGTVADGALSNSVEISVSATTLSFGYETALRVESAITLRRHGPGGVGTANGKTGQSVTARPAADNIPNVSNPLYWTLTCQMSAGTPEWIAITQFEIVVL